MTLARPTFILALFAVLGSIGAQQLASAEDPKPCAKSSYAILELDKACKSGGQLAAKKLMKAAVDKARAAGKEMTCKTCHSSLSDFATLPNAGADLKPLL
jgi:hypothetical protein